MWNVDVKFAGPKKGRLFKRMLFKSLLALKRAVSSTVYVLVEFAAL
jgi:hypothetical protein